MYRPDQIMCSLCQQQNEQMSNPEGQGARQVSEKELVTEHLSKRRWYPFWD